MKHLQSVLDDVPHSVLPLFVHQCMDQMCGRDGLEKAAFIPDVFPDEEALQKAVSICQEFVKHSIDIRDKKDVAISMNDETMKVMYDCLECRRPELRSGIIAGIVRNSSKEFLLDSDWRVSFIFSSSKICKIREPVVLFTLMLSTREKRTLELSLNELDRLLAALQEARSLLAD